MLKLECHISKENKIVNYLYGVIPICQEEKKEKEKKRKIYRQKKNFNKIYQNNMNYVAYDFWYSFIKNNHIL